MRSCEIYNLIAHAKLESHIECCQLSDWDGLVRKLAKYEERRITFESHANLINEVNDLGASGAFHRPTGAKESEQQRQLGIFGKR